MADETLRGTSSRHVFTAFSGLIRSAIAFGFLAKTYRYLSLHSCHLSYTRTIACPSRISARAFGRLCDLWALKRLFVIYGHSHSTLLSSSRYPSRGGKRDSHPSAATSERASASCRHECLEAFARTPAALCRARRECAHSSADGTTNAHVTGMLQLAKRLRRSGREPRFCGEAPNLLP